MNTRRQALSAMVLMLGAPLAGAAPGRTPVPPAAGPDAAFDRLAQRYFDDLMALDPLNASITTADPRYAGKLAITIAPEHIARSQRLFDRVAGELLALPAAQLGPGRRLSHELLQWDVDMARRARHFPDHLMPMDHNGGLPLQLAIMGGGDQGQPLRTPQDFDQFLARLARLPAYNQQAMANMREGLQRGITVPVALIDSGRATFAQLAEPDFDRSPFSGALKVLPAQFSPAQRSRIERAYRRLFERDLRPSMAALVNFTTGPYARGCRFSDGLSALPDGPAWYQHLVRFHTTTALSADEVHALGLAEVERLLGDIARLQKHYGVAGSLSDFLHWHDRQPRFHPWASWDEIVQAHAELDARLTPLLAPLFGRQPRQPFVVRAMPELQRDSGSSYYNPAAPDGSRPGIFFVGSPEPPQRYGSTYLTSLLLHEGRPGHHFQIGLQQELDLPDFRRFGWSTAFGEGWALYAETLGHEMGLYDDPNQWLGHLRMELLRAVRLVVDTGLHAFGWSRGRSIRYMMDTQGETEAEARQATDRYMAAPGQALGYKIGALRFQALRQQARAALGDRFALADFHDLVLSQGTVPLPVLQGLVQDWIGAGGGRP